MPLPPDADVLVEAYRRRYPRTRANGMRALRALYELLAASPAGGFTVRDVAARAGVGLDTVARVLQHLRGMGVLTVAGGGWVAERGGRPGHGVRFRYAAHWPPVEPGNARRGGHDAGGGHRR
ncbi:MAG TPA: hypothetical protein VOB72_01165 [Candidatus Dormibacteraeota bacterium]|nr:hypothetical protein [Candidatus Dormibacteraeota bacterium]